MKNLEQLKSEYREFTERQYMIDNLLDINMKEFLTKPKNSDFVLIESEAFYDLVMSHMDEEEVYEEYKDIDMDKLQKEYDEYTKHLENAVNVRLSLFCEQVKLREDINKWMYTNNMSYSKIDETWMEGVRKFENKWRGWDSNDLTYEMMRITLELADEEEINEAIKNARKIIDIMESTGDDEGHLIDFVNDLEFINTKLRHGDIRGCEHVFVLDCLENDGMWDIYREPFIMYVDNVMKWIDSDFRYFAKHNEI